MIAKTARHVLFDLDGTLVDTRAAVECCYRRVFTNTLEQPFPPADLPADLYAMRPAEVFQLVAPERADELYEAYRTNYPLCADQVRVFDGATDLIRELIADGRKPSLVTNKGIERTLIDLSVAGIAPEDFVAIVTAEDTAERKPHPAPILLGLERAGGEAADSIYVGDGPQDVLAARAAGMDCIAVTYGFYSLDDLKPLDPAAIAGTIEELAGKLGIRAHRGTAA
ncbi:HAD family hydrolase [Hoeflea sp.]|uniref:HAD family hydrolase n=1 Tax=Hoeflea sp. TaxID=1940281 RepID=UPI0019A3B211|nr:HAD family hydrolase [Hoeflea sp.]MBC7282719.1 HAD family hydrolase [Hoeflea sp.]